MKEQTLKNSEEGVFSLKTRVRDLEIVLEITNNFFHNLYEASEISSSVFRQWQSIIGDYIDSIKKSTKQNRKK